MKEKPVIYLLNLDRHKNRLKNAQKQLEQQNLSFERFAAIDARDAGEDILSEFTDKTGPIPRMGAGARACTVGHFNMWKQFLKTDARNAFILEDDIRISNSFAEFLVMATECSKDVDILNFNRQDSKRTLKKLVVSKKNNLTKTGFIAQSLLGPHYGTAGYMITRAAAEFLCYQVKRTNIPIDHLLFNPNVSKFNRSWRIYQTFPAFVEPDVAQFQTSIQKETVVASGRIGKRLLRAYYEINRVPFLATQILFGQAEIKPLRFADQLGKEKPIVIAQ